MAHYRLTAKGILPGETFNFGVHVSGASGDAAGAATAWASALTAAWTDATDGFRSHYTTDVQIVAGHAAELSDLTGKQIDASEASLSLAGTVAIAAGHQMLPHEVAVAITTRGAARNRKDQGRWYMPPPDIAEVAAGLLNAATRGHFANAAAILINTLQGAAFNPVILHPDHTDTPIVDVECGSVFDAQRRRRNKLIEARTVVGV